MIQKVNVTTIAMYMNFGDSLKWVIDTYVRFTPKKDFINNFMKEYAGNDIEKIKIIDEWENEYDIDDLRDFDVMIRNIKENFEGINNTVLNY